MTDRHRLPASSIPRYDSPRPVRYTLSDLEHETGVNARTIRYYISEGLLQPAYGRGPSATYDPDHLLRLQLIQKLKDDRLSLRDIKEQLSHLTPEDIAVLLKVQMQPQADVWRRYELHPDLEITVRDRQPGERALTYDQAFDLIIEYARSVLDDLAPREDHL
jgi:DNA-binding transcriptional MerR regulator